MFTIIIVPGEIVFMPAKSLMISMEGAFIVILDPIFPEIVIVVVVLEKSLNLKPARISCIAIHQKFEYPAPLNKNRKDYSL